VTLPDDKRKGKVAQASAYIPPRSGLGRGFFLGPSVVKVYRDYNLLQSHDFTPNIVYRDPGLVTSLDLTHTMSTSNGIHPPSLNLPVGMVSPAPIAQLRS
jgi:hypothetical protein